MQGDGLIEANRSALAATIAVLDSCTAREHRFEAEPDASVGAHVRHILEHYQSLLDGARGGRVDYDARPRQPLLEEDRGAAADFARRLRGRLAGLTDLDRALDVADRPLPQAPVRVSPSSLGRELQFVLSHTVHHQALIRMRLQVLRGADACPDGFGVAPSTLHHRDRTDRKTG
jgi:uncharacterized damage-inducible protein DinB